MDKELIEFLIRAKIKTYAGKGKEEEPSRLKSHDLKYIENNLMYYDTYLGGDKFSGTEALWKDNIPIWSMNYVGRVIGNNFSGDFLKEALKRVPFDKPFRGPKEYIEGDYKYISNVIGVISWFNGKEEIYYKNELIYECFYHGGLIK